MLKGPSFVAHLGRFDPGDPVVGDWLKIMASEHCEGPDSLVTFHTSNYGITSTPAQEWSITTTRDESLADMRHGRRLPDPEELWRSDVATKAGLTLAEVTAVVLYTGPMVGRARAVPCDPCIAAHHRHIIPGPIRTATPIRNFCLSMSFAVTLCRA